MEDNTTFVPKTAEPPAHHHKINSTWCSDLRRRGAGATVPRRLSCIASSAPARISEQLALVVQLIPLFYKHRVARARSSDRASSRTREGSELSSRLHYFRRSSGPVSSSLGRYAQCPECPGRKTFARSPLARIFPRSHVASANNRSA